MITFDIKYDLQFMNELKEIEKFLISISYFFEYPKLLTSSSQIQYKFRSN